MSDRLPDVVYVLKAAEDNEELRYSLRSLENIPHGRLFIVGHKPWWVQNCEHIYTTQIRTKYENSTQNLIEACKSKLLSDDFIYMNDDFFIMDKMDTVPVFHRGRVEDVIKVYARKGDGFYVNGMQETRDLMRVMGLKNLRSYELHVPMTINKHVFLEVIEKQRELSPKIVAVHKRTLYGNYAGIGGKKIDDVKIYDDSMPFSEEWPFISTQDETFRIGRVGKYIRKRFPHKSMYEK